MLLAIALLVAVSMIMPAFPRKAHAAKVGPGISGSLGSPLTALQMSPVGCNGANFIQPAGSPVAAGTSPAAVAVGDFNHDGIPDLAVANPTTGQVTILLGGGSGGFTQATGSPFSTGTGTTPVALVTGDFNHDGNLDLATANPNPSNSVSVLLGDGGGGFTPATGSPFALDNDGFTIANPLSIAIGDFNRDGNLDLVTANASSGTLTILTGDGSGSFIITATIPAGGQPVFVAVGDFNNDGRDDLVYTDNGHNTANVLLATAGGGFTAVTPGTSVGSVPEFVAIGDFNRDGKLDLAIANENSNNVTILTGNGDGTFAADATISVGDGPQAIAVGDFNQDGKPDLATVNFRDDDVSILEGDGSGGFAEVAGLSLTVGATPVGLAVGDFNRDGKDDIVTANLESDNVTVLLNNCPFSKCANTNFATVPGLVVGNQLLNMAIGDFNNDGITDLVVADANNAISPSVIGNVDVLLGDGKGGFSLKQTLPSGGSSPLAIGVGDFNRDGKQDLAVCNAVSGNVVIMIGNGDGTFNASAVSPVDLGSDAFPSSIAVGDFNNDDKPDLAITNGNGTVTILLGDGSGGFSQATGSPYSADSSDGDPISIQIGDFNRDGNQDLVFVNFNGSSTVVVLLGDGKGGFTQAAGSPFALGGGSPRSVAIGDFNQDGKQDLAIATPEGSDGGNLSIMLGDGTGSFSPAAGSPLMEGGSPFTVAVGHFNGDGKEDLVATDLNSNVHILLGNGSGGFSEPANSPLSNPVQAGFLVVGDFNRDGKDDLATGPFNVNEFNVLLNDCAAPMPPTITTSPVSRMASSPSSNSQIATVSDPQDAANTLAITVNGGASATVNGVTVSGITTSAAGAVTADVVAGCGATGANFTLQVTDSFGLSAQAMLTVTVTPDSPASITASPMSQGVCPGSPVSFSAAASGTPTPTVQWQVSTGGAFTNIPGATSTTLSINSVTAAQNGNKYQAVFTNSCAVVTSQPATLTVNAVPSVTVSPTNQAACAGGSASFTASASGTPAPTVQWQVSSGGRFTNISGATSTTLTINSVTAAQNGNIYQAVFTNSCASVTSSAATLMVNAAPTVSASPINQAVCSGSAVSFTAAANGTPAPTVQWQVSSGGSFTNILGATSTTLTLNSVTFAQNGYKYQAVFTNGCNT
ncbi:MAG TPA: FG-GAP-like repeat-containing protein, partial [Blastocatellia bacterium]